MTEDTNQRNIDLSLQELYLLHILSKAGATMIRGHLVSGQLEEAKIEPTKAMLNDAEHLTERLEQFFEGVREEQSDGQGAAGADT